MTSDRGVRVQFKWTLRPGRYALLQELASTPVRAKQTPGQGRVPSKAAAQDSAPPATAKSNVLDMIRRLERERAEK